jgi:S-adenosylmethionine-dependent methyltransferase
MLQDAQARFDARAEAWTRYNQEPLGRIRREVTWHNLLPYLPDIPNGQDPPCVLDAGGGSGELALRLAQGGYRVWLLDYASAMLDKARRAAEALPSSARANLAFCLMPVSDVPHAFAPGFFDAIFCHTVIEYLPEPRAALRGLARLLRAGGLLSLSFVNRHAEVLRQVWRRGDPAGALAKLEDGAFCAGLFDVSGIAYTAGEVSSWLVEMGLVVAESLGVRFFADYVPAARLGEPEFLEALLCLEVAAASQSPYHQLARYVHLLAHRSE